MSGDNFKPCEGSVRMYRLYWSSDMFFDGTKSWEITVTNGRITRTDHPSHGFPNTSHLTVSTSLELVIYVAFDEGSSGKLDVNWKYPP
jgi:hypothetical protein